MLRQINKIGTLLIVALIFLMIAVSGCARKEVKFEGKVYDGYIDPISNLIVVTGPAATAEVWAESEPSKVAKVDSNGDYLLTLKAPYSIGSAPVREYTLVATEGGTIGGSDEKITVKGVIGETNKVRDFILYKHTVEE